MENYVIICVDDEPEVLDSVTRALSDFEDLFPIETAGTADDAREVIRGVLTSGDTVALIVCDHLMPNESGVSFLTSLSNDIQGPLPRKVLLTGQASHEDTICAINQGGIDYYVAKPWDSAELCKLISTQLSHFFVRIGTLPRSGTRMLDSLVVSSAIRDGVLTWEQ